MKGLPHYNATDKTQVGRARGHVDTCKHTTPKNIKTWVQNIINDIRAPSNPQGNDWNYIACSPFSEIYQQIPFSLKDITTPHTLINTFITSLRLWFIHNSHDVELCCSFPSFVRDAALCWPASLPPWSISGFQEHGQKFHHHFTVERERSSRLPIIYSLSSNNNSNPSEHTQKR